MPVQKFKFKPIKNTTKTEQSDYFVIFDEYLRPKNQQFFNEKTREILAFSGAHYKPLTLNESIREKWRHLAEKFTHQRVVKVKPLNNLIKDTKKINVQQKALKQKSGFQIYCELASVHGLQYLTGASKWQRIFWCFILCSMLTLSIYTLWNSLSLNADNPTILYTDTKTGIFWGNTFPAITFCNLNHISKKKLNELLMKNFSSETANQIRPLIPYVLYSALPVNATPVEYRSLHRLLTSANYTHSDFLEKISPDCESQLIRCKILDQVHPCNVLLQRVQTEHGFCCSFNFNAIINGNQTAEELSIHSNRFGAKWGLSVLLDPQIEDYYASRNKFGGYQVYAHNGSDFLNINDPHQLVFPGDSIHIHTAPLVTEATTLLKNQDLHLRRCYLRNERKLLTLAEYTQQNCFSECRSRKVLKSCGCVPPLWPRAQNWTVCTLLEASCVMAQIDTISTTIYPSNTDYKTDLKAERYICDCYPECEFCGYKADFDSMGLDRNYSINNMDLYRGIELKNHLVVHAFYADMFGDYMRLDVAYHWQNYFGLFGGITSLYMGISFIAVFEIIFFLSVRPVAHLLTRINKRRQAMKKQKELKKIHKVMRN